MDLSKIENDIERVIVDEKTLQEKIKELAARVDKDYENKTLNSFTLKEEHANNYTFDEKRPFNVSLKVTWMFNWGDWNGKEHYWSHLLAKIILSIYGICLLLIFNFVFK